MDVTEAIITGVVSGVFTSFILWVLVRIFNEIIIPRYQAIIYRGIIIEGRWEGFFEELIKKETSDRERKPYSIINLKQNGHKVTGEQVINVQPSGRDTQKQLWLNGMFRDNNLLLSFGPKEKTRLGMGSYVMKLVEDGWKFEGTSTFVGSVRGKVVTVSEFWVRSKEFV